MAQSQNEERKAWYHAFRNFKWNIVAGMKMAFPAKVISYDKKHHTADIQPLVMNSDGEVSAQYLDVPVVESCYIIDEIIERYKPELKTLDQAAKTNLVDKLPKKKFMRVGVPVICVVLDRDNDNWEGGRKANIFMPNSSRVHDANDAIIVGVLGGDAING